MCILLFQDKSKSRWQNGMECRSKVVVYNIVNIWIQRHERSRTENSRRTRQDDRRKRKSASEKIIASAFKKNHRVQNSCLPFSLCVFLSRRDKRLSTYQYFLVLHAIAAQHF